MLSALSNLPREDVLSSVGDSLAPENDEKRGDDEIVLSLAVVLMLE